MTCTGRDIRPQELKLRFDQKTLNWKKISNSADRDTPQLPPEMESFANFIMSIGSYEGDNTARRFHGLFSIIEMGSSPVFP